MSTSVDIKSKFRGRKLSRGLHALTRHEATINTNVGWHAYYVGRFNRYEHADQAILAMFYLFCALREGEVT